MAEHQYKKSTYVREQILKTLRQVSEIGNSHLWGNPIEFKGSKIDAGIECKQSDLDGALLTIDNTNWFERMSNQFLVGKIKVTFYAI